MPWTRHMRAEPHSLTIWQHIYLPSSTSSLTNTPCIQLPLLNSPAALHICLLSFAFLIDTPSFSCLFSFFRSLIYIGIHPRQLPSPLASFSWGSSAACIFHLRRVRENQLQKASASLCNIPYYGYYWSGAPRKASYFYFFQQINPISLCAVQRDTMHISLH